MNEINDKIILHVFSGFTVYFIMNKTDSLTEVRKALPENCQCEIIFNGAGKLILLTVYEFEN